MRKHSKIQKQTPKYKKTQKFATIIKAAMKSCEKIRYTPNGIDV